jgi:hypothetical protein
MKLITTLCVGLLFLLPGYAFSEPSQAETESAMQEAMFLLNNPDAREAYIRNNPNTRQADKSLRGLAGSEQTTEEMYQLASDIFAQITLKANGDPDKMMLLLQKAQSNPEAFAKSFTPEQKQKLSDLARQVESNRQQK